MAFQISDADECYALRVLNFYAALIEPFTRQLGIYFLHQCIVVVLIGSLFSDSANDLNWLNDFRISPL